jgi:hypothetical protein
VSPCSPLKVYRGFGGTNYQTTLRHILEGINLHTPLRENIKSHKIRLELHVTCVRLRLSAHWILIHTKVSCPNMHEYVRTIPALIVSNTMDARRLHTGISPAYTRARIQCSLTLQLELGLFVRIRAYSDNLLSYEYGSMCA